MNNEKVIIKNSKGLIVLVVILLITTIGLIAYIVYDKMDVKEEKVTNQNSKETIKNENKKEDYPRNLTNEELSYFKDYFNKKEINKFLTIGTYSDIKNVDPNILLYDGIGEYGYDSSKMSQEEISEYLKTVGSEELHTDVDVMKKDSLNKYLMENANITLNDFKTELKFTYVPKYDAYYNMHGDTIMINIDSIINGKIDENNIYIIHYKLMNANLEVAMKKNNDKYIFFSNTCLDNCNDYYNTDFTKKYE